MIRDGEIRAKVDEQLNNFTIEQCVKDRSVMIRSTEIYIRPGVQQ